MRWRFFRSLTFRLILWNIVGFLIAYAVTLYLFDIQNIKYFDNRLDRSIGTKLYEIKELMAPDLDYDLFRSEIDHHSRAMGTDTIFYRLLKEDGTTLMTSDLSTWGTVQLSPSARKALAVPGDQVWQDLPEAGTDGARAVAMRLQGGDIVQVGISMRERNQLLLWARLVLTGAMLLVSLLAAAFSAAIAMGTLKGMRRISRTLSRITNQGAFQHRIELPTGSVETDELAETFNKLFAKIRELMEGMEQVLGDIAHDMRTPVTRIRGAAESLLSEPGLSQREEEMAGNTIEECDRILGLVNTILEINAAESQLKASSRKPVNLVALVREGAELFAFMVEDKQLELELSLPAEAPVLGDLGHLQRVISNLLDNAIKYTPAGGQINVHLSATDGKVTLVFDDTGVGVPAGESELIFQRFYRSDKSRTLPGNGLGLTFCKAVLTGMGGNIRHLPKAGPGSLFEVTLPAARFPSASAGA